MIERRQIEAAILKHVYDTLKASHGVEVAKKTVADTVRSSSIEQAKEFAAKVVVEDVDADFHGSPGALEEIGHLLSRQRDETFCEGYDKRLRLTRTQTIMQGASHSDFNYKLVDEPSSTWTDVRFWSNAEIFRSCVAPCDTAKGSGRAQCSLAS